MEQAIQWCLTLILFNGLLAYSVAAVFCSAPDHWTKGVLFMFGLGFLTLMLHYALKIVYLINGSDIWWSLNDVKLLGLTFIYFAVVLHLLRITWREKLSCRSLSKHSPYFQD